MADYLYQEGMGVPLVDPDTGEAQWLPEADAIKLIGIGWKPTTPEAITQQLKGQQQASLYDQPVQAAVHGAISGATLGLGPLLGRAIGGDEYAKYASRLQEYNPTTVAAGEIGGAIGTAFIPGAPMALLGKAGQAAQVGVKGALGGGRAAGAAGLATRGVAEGAGIGLGGAVSEVATTDKPIEQQNIGETIARHVSTGAVFGGGLALGVGGVAAAGKWVAGKAGLGKAARENLAEVAALTKQAQVLGENKAAQAADLQTRVLSPDVRVGIERTVADLEAEIGAKAKATARLKKPGSPTAAGAEEDVYGIAQLNLQTIEKYHGVPDGPPGLLPQARAAVDRWKADIAALQGQAAELGGTKAVGKVKAPTAEPPAATAAPSVQAEVAANPDLARMVGEAQALRKASGGIPSLPERWDAVIGRIRADHPKLIEGALAKGGKPRDFQAQVNSLWKNRWGSRGTEKGIVERVVAMERRLGLPDLGDTGRKLAGAEYAVLHLGKKAGAGWDWAGALKASTKRAAPAAAPTAEAAGRAAVPLETSLRQDVTNLVADAKGSLKEAQLQLKEYTAQWSELAAKYNLKPGQAQGYRDAIAKWRRASGKEGPLQTALQQLEEDKALQANLKRLAEETPEEAAVRGQLEQVIGKMDRGEGGMLGRIAKQTALRSMEWQGAKAVTMGLGGKSVLRGDIRSIAGFAAGRALAPRILSGLSRLVSPGTQLQALSKGVGAVGGLGSLAVRAGKTAGTIAAPGVKVGAIRALSQEDFDSISDDLTVPLQAYETVTRAALAGQPEELVDAVMTTHIRQREFLASKMPRDPRGSAVPEGIPAIPTSSRKWVPSLPERQKFGRYARAAAHWKTALEDLVNGSATVETMEALRTVYPDVAQALQTFVANGVRKTIAEGGRYGATEARMIDLILGPPYQLNQNVRVFQASFHQRPRKQPTRGMGSGAITLSKGLMPQLQAAQAGLTR